MIKFKHNSKGHVTKEPKHGHQANNCLLVIVYVVGALDAKTRFNLMSSLSIKSTKWQLMGLCHVGCRIVLTRGCCSNMWSPLWNCNLMSGSKFKLFTNGVPNMNFDKYDSHSYSQNSFSFIGIPYTNKIWLVMTPLLGLYYYTHILLTIVGHEFQHVVLQIQQDSSICDC